jgi:hypothetical protein
MCSMKNGFGSGGFGGGNDVMEIEILEDGTIKTTTDPISGANHANAEEFLRFVGRMAGGDVKREKRTRTTGHVHHQKKIGQ